MVGYSQGELTRRTFALMISANYFSTFGIRSFAFDVNKGFSLNGKPLKLAVAPLSFATRGSAPASSSVCVRRFGISAATSGKFHNRHPAQVIFTAPCNQHQAA